MKYSKLNNYLINEIQQFEYFWEREVYWGGIVVISNLYSFLGKINISEKRKFEWVEKKIKEVEVNFSSSIVGKIQNEFIEIYKRLKKIISVGSRFNDDEFLLLIVYHTELCLVEEYMKSMDIDMPNLNLEEIEEQIKELGSIKKNIRDFRSALSQMRKNSPLPIDIVWMKDNI